MIGPRIYLTDRFDSDRALSCGFLRLLSSGKAFEDHKNTR